RVLQLLHLRPLADRRVPAPAPSRAAGGLGHRADAWTGRAGRLQRGRREPGGVPPLEAPGGGVAADRDALLAGGAAPLLPAVRQPPAAADELAGPGAPG